MGQPGLRRLTLLMLVCLLLVPQISAKEDRGNDWGVRATLLMTIAYLTQWPQAVLPEPDSSLRIGVLGEGSDTAQILRALNERIGHPDQNLISVNKRTIKVNQCKNLEEAGRCHIVYVTFAEKERWPQILRTLQNKSLITVGETEEFVRLGGAISFREGKKGYVFWGNLDEVRRLRREKVMINAELLEPPFVTYVLR